MTFSVVVTRTRTIVSSTEIEIVAKDEEAAQEKAEAKISKAQKEPEGKRLEEAFDWSEDSDDDEFEYEASEA